jgi:hypothetical protein
MALLKYLKVDSKMMLTTAATCAMSHDSVFKTDAEKKISPNILPGFKQMREN